MEFDDVDYLETWHTLEQFQRENLVHHIGVSNFNRSQLERLLANCKSFPEVLQVAFLVFINLFWYNQLRDYRIDLPTDCNWKRKYYICYFCRIACYFPLFEFQYYNGLINRLTWNKLVVPILYIVYCTDINLNRFICTEYSNYKSSSLMGIDWQIVQKVESLNESE